MHSKKECKTDTALRKGVHRERYSEYRDQPRLHPRGTRAVYERPLQSQGPILARKPRYPTEEPRPGALLRVSCSSLVIKPQVKSLRMSKEPKGSELFRGISRNLCQKRPSRDYFSGGSTLPQASDARFDGGDLIFRRARTCRDSHLGAPVEPGRIELRSALDVMRIPAHRRANLGKTGRVR